MPIKAQDLMKEQKNREKQKIIIFDKIYNLIEKKIKTASDSDFYHIIYELPIFMIGSSLYSYQNCKDYIGNKLRENGFDVYYYEPNIFIIKWSQ